MSDTNDTSATGTERTAAKAIVDLCEHSPPQDVDGHPRLFDDLDDDRMSDALFQLWQKGIVDAEWDDEDQATEWCLTHFGVELNEKGLVRPYVEATENEIELDVGPKLLADPEDVR